MNEYKFNVQDQARKSLVSAISEITQSKITYNGAPTFSYDCGGYHIDKVGTVTGEFDLKLFAALAERGFDYEASQTFHLITPRGTLLCQKRFDTAAQAEAEGYGVYFHHEGRDVYSRLTPDGATEHSRQFAVVGTPFEKPETEPEAPAEPEYPDRLTIEMPLEGFTPEALENLTKMVIAKPRDLGETSEKFAMRVWLIGLGLIGAEYKSCRALLMQNLTGNASFPDDGKYKTMQESRRKAAKEAALAPETSEESEVGADD